MNFLYFSDYITIVPTMIFAQKTMNQKQKKNENRKGFLHTETIKGYHIFSNQNSEFRSFLEELRKP